jgi:phosphatidylglycerol:prolipoprotein diacylglycerol transferase
VHSTFFQLGRLHIPVFGVFAAFGLMAAFTLGQKTARYARLDPESVWNAAMTTVVSAFVISRVLLVVFNWHSFLQYPLLLLALPSLTSIGILLTGLFMLGYLRWRGLPLLVFLDAMAPCAALLWMFLSAGRFAEGTRDGMPTQLGWAVRDGGVARVQPVEIYTLGIAAVICLVLLRVLKQSDHAGRTAGIGLAFAGFAIYFIDFFRLPSDLLSTAWFDPAQFVAIAMVVIGSVLALGRETKIQRVTGKESNDAV